MNLRQISVLFLTSLFLIFTSCDRQQRNTELSVPEFNPLISAFTSGVISSESSIRIRFAEPFADSVAPNTPVDGNVFSLSPSVKGLVYYSDRQTIEFVPETGLEPGTAYTAEVRLSRLFPRSKGEKSFSFEFNTIEQHLQIEIIAFRPYNDYKPGMNYLTGMLKTADAADPSAVEAVLTVTQGRKNLPVEWDHNAEGTEHSFKIDSVRRAETELLVEVAYDGSVIRSAQKGIEEFTVPSLGDFKVIGHKLVQYPEQHIVVSFSDPLRKNQYLEGLVRLSNNTGMRYVIEGNIISAYPNVRQNGLLTLFVEPGIRNTAGKGLKAGERFDVLFEEIKPSVQLLGNGVIVPDADEVLLPFKAVNLKAVDVKVIRIYEDNIAQFLQVNQLSGNSELKRAGRLIMKRTINLVADKPVNYGEWNTFSLDLTDLVKTEPGAIYRVEMNFRQSQSLFPCGNSDDQEDQLVEDENYDQVTDEEISYWDSYESYYSNWDYYNYDGYTWSDREDPCKPAYFGKRRAVARNILASNLGVIAKYGSGQQLDVTVTDLIKASPVSNATVRVYNFQQQLLQEESANGNGMVSFQMKNKPFLVVAEHNQQKGYVRMVEGSALSYSMFDVSGSVIQKGIKGFIYGDRGVWRPGDSIYLNLIIDDQANPLPGDHPVTFTLRDPLGKVVQQRVATGNSTGFFPFHTSTTPDAPTGNYSVIAEVGGAKFSKTVRIETIKPNRLRIALDFPGDTIYPAKGPISTTLTGEWLTGATARNLDAEIEVFFTPSTTAFEGYSGYTFQHPGRKLASVSSTFFSGTVDNQGVARFSKSLYIDGEAPGMLNAVFTTRIFEKSGDFSIDQKTVQCSPYNTYVGIKLPPGDKRGMLLTDTAHTVNVVTLSETGEPQTKIGLDVKVYKLSWRWWWDASTENLASYMGSNYQTPVYSSTMSTRNGKGSFDFKVEYPEWGRYLVMVTDKGGHSAAKVVYIDWPGWAGKSRKGDPEAATVLSFSADKEVYEVGETATITIPASAGGKLLISLENGSRVLKQEWLETSGSETRYTLPVTAEMTPNIYVYAALIQPHAQTENDLPIRMFGVIPLRVEDPGTRLYPELNMPEELSPNSTVTIEVSEKHKRDMTYTIAMVDEGLLDLTRFKTPDPWSVFYAREALGVKTWDMFEHVLGAYGGRIDGIYSIGGGMDESGEGAKDANRFPPMVRFMGPFTLSGKKNVHQVTIPNYIGSIRTMLVAGDHGKYGHAEKTTPVKQPLMLLATLPRVLGPGEEVALPVNVFVMDEKIRKVDISVSTNDMLIAADERQTVSFSGTGDKIVDFILKTPSKTGVGKVSITARSGSHTATYEIELNVRSSNPPVTNFITAAVEAGDSYTHDFEYIGMHGTNDLLLEVSNIPPVDFGRRLKYLLRYPHGCIEQTTSAAFPQLFLGDVVELKESVKETTERNIKAAIRRLSSFQLSSGGFSYWPGSIRESSWGTSYAGHFMLEAAEKGYQVPGAMLNNWERYQRKAARRWSISGSAHAYEIRQEQILQSYRLFTLALAGKPEMGSMNRLRERTDLVLQAKWRLAAAYALTGQTETAMELVANAPTEIAEYYDSHYSYGSSTRDKAMILEAMVLMDKKGDAVPLLEQIAGSLSSRRWMSTQTTAYSLLAIAKYTGGNTSAERLDFQYAFNDEKLQRAETGLPLAQLQFEPGEDASGKVKVVNNSGGVSFVRIINSGLPEPGKEQAMKKNLDIMVQYVDMEGRRIDPARIPQGTDFKMVCQVHHPGGLGYYHNVALTTMFPSGWEIHNERLFNTSSENESFDYQDIRDDRIMTYFGLRENRSITVTVRLNAAYRGRFYLPSIQGEEMYMNDVQTVIPGQWIEVIGYQ